MVMAMISGLTRYTNSGENGDAVRGDHAYPHIAMRSRRLFPAVRTRDEIASDGGGSAFWSSVVSYPDSIPRPTGSYS
jgi:hypothetical protein